MRFLSILAGTSRPKADAALIMRALLAMQREFLSIQDLFCQRCRHDWRAEEEFVGTAASGRPILDHFTIEKGEHIPFYHRERRAYPNLPVWKPITSDTPLGQRGKFRCVPEQHQTGTKNQWVPKCLFFQRAIGKEKSSEDVPSFLFLKTLPFHLETQVELVKRTVGVSRGNTIRGNRTERF